MLKDVSQDRSGDARRSESGETFLSQGCLGAEYLAQHSFEPLEWPQLFGRELPAQYLRIQDVKTIEAAEPNVGSEDIPQSIQRSISPSSQIPNISTSCRRPLE